MQKITSPNLLATHLQAPSDTKLKTLGAYG